MSFSLLSSATRDRTNHQPHTYRSLLLETQSTACIVGCCGLLSFRFSLQEIKFYSLSFANCNHVSVGVCHGCVCVLRTIDSVCRLQWLNIELNEIEFDGIPSNRIALYTINLCLCGGAASVSMRVQLVGDTEEREKLLGMKIGIQH